MTTDIDEFANSLLEESKRFLELASECEDPAGQAAYRHGSLMLGFCALEAHVNAIATDFVGRSDLSAHESALLTERRVRLQDGEFVISDSLEMIRLEDRIQFLHRKFSGTPIDRSSIWWSELHSAMKLRNSLTHPKDATTASQGDANRAIQAIIDTIDALFLAIYKKPLPVASRGLQSKLSF